MTEPGFLPLALYAGFFVFGFVAVYFAARWLKAKGVTGRDINKADEPVLPESGGVALLLPLWAFVLGYQALKGLALDLLALACLATGYALVGFLDDTRNKFAGKPLSWTARALPIAALSAAFAWNYGGSAEGFVALALFVGIIASFHNTLAGLNGLEVGLGWLMGLAGVFLLQGTPLFLPALAFNAMVLGLLAWNVFPARVFPGDSGTLLVGALNAGLIALSLDARLMAGYTLLFAPHALDLGLKLLTNVGDITQSRRRPYALDEEGRIALPKDADGRTRYDLAKLLVRLAGPRREAELVLGLWLVAAGWVVVVFLFLKPFG